jgi:hypothetical protein
VVVSPWGTAPPPAPDGGEAGSSPTSVLGAGLSCCTSDAAGVGDAVARGVASPLLGVGAGVGVAPTDGSPTDGSGNDGMGSGNVGSGMTTIGVGVGIGTGVGRGVGTGVGVTVGPPTTTMGGTPSSAPDPVQSSRL